MDLKTFVTQQQMAIESFQQFWLDSNKRDPENYALDQLNLSTWDEQLEIYRAFLFETGLL